MENIKQYLGIPAELIPQVFWVGREYRKNELSFKNGGVEIIIEYTDGQVFGYDWVKYPGRYIKKVFDNTFLVNAHLNEFETIKKNVSRVFARRCDSEDYNAESFTEVWNNSTSENLPYTLLDNYILKVYKYYLNFFLNNIEFAKQYISMHYPFDYSFLIENWSFLEQGTAHYCVYLIDTETIYPSIFGLAFNKNIRWNSKLRARFEYGFDNHFIGYVEGTGIGPVEFEERDYLDNMIPLDKQKEIESQNHAAFSHWLNAVGPYLNYDDPENFQDAPSHDIEKIFANFESLEFSDFKDIYKRSKLTALLNDSIWENTLKFIIDENFCERIIEEIRKNITENSNEEHDSRLD